MRVFLDANVLFSAARIGSMVERALRELSDGGARLLTSQHAATEARRNLAAKRPDDLPNLEAWLARMEVTTLMADVSHLPLSDKDRPVFGGAMAVGLHAFCHRGYAAFRRLDRKDGRGYQGENLGRTAGRIG